MTPDQKDAQARNRYFAITFTRLLGVAFVVFGIMVVYGRFESIPKIVGYVLVVNGLIDIVILPRVMARRWRTPPAA
ncbi:hypothetical protein [Sphingobium boeckii]|uniref:Uncharacterized membrane protein HdeD (DUF308 family) n=1 Tax=Sphingobium boeckii TaxID=1082345 RepID=A0A7W9EE67_9SPHN|nr:hypothetical protein [Sphingobium boeckii]MBB5684366.1 uncharacterized membrane protein HdeD (DUF308 family) [Sphingobium boeckii]